MLAPGGWTVWEALILLCFLGTMPWTALSAANALVGLAILLGAKIPSPPCCRRRAPPARHARRAAPPSPSASATRTWPAVLPPLARLMDGLAAAGAADRFALWMLSDTPAGPAAEAEEAAIRAFAGARTDTQLPSPRRQ